MLRFYVNVVHMSTYVCLSHAGYLEIPDYYYTFFLIPLFIQYILIKILVCWVNYHDRMTLAK